MGISGKIAALFQQSRMTPLLALLMLLMGLFAVLVTPREEEPQINVTMANVLIPFPGASAQDVEQMVSGPAEQVLSQIQGMEHVMSVSRPGLSIITVQYKVGVPRIEALVRLYDTINANSDWLPPGLGVLQPIVKPKGIDDVPIVTFTLFSKNPQLGPFELERVAHSLESDLKRVAGSREVTTVGGPGQALRVDMDPARMNALGVSVDEVQRVLSSANQGRPLGHLLAGNKSLALEAGEFLRNADDVRNLVVSVKGGRPVLMSQVAHVETNVQNPAHYAWFGQKDGNATHEYGAVTISVTKKPGENAIVVADALQKRIESLKNRVIPAEVNVVTTRNYGETANDKAVKLIEKLLFATSLVVALVFFALGRREAMIVGLAVILTLTITLFASWAWGFTLNRVSLFALIFSIGILVDDAIVVVENIHRHQSLYPDKTLLELIPHAVDEVGGPTILATLTVIAALLPMAFVSGLMGPYMSPIPINASMGMLLSLAIAFTLTPWLCNLWLKHDHSSGHEVKAGSIATRLNPWFTRLFGALLHDQKGPVARRKLTWGVVGLIAFSVLLPVVGLVHLKMLPFDDKSEFQVVVDMPSGSSLEQTAAVLHEMGQYLGQDNEVQNYQAYTGLSAPINFNGLVRQYYLRSGNEVGDIQVNLKSKHDRQEKSHVIATRLRPGLTAIAQKWGARVKVVEVPPGPPVLAPIVAEVYGPDAEGRRTLARQIRQVFSQTPGVVDVDDSSIDPGPRKLLVVDRSKAAHSGISQQQVVNALTAGSGGQAATWLHDQNKYPAPVWMQLPAQEQGTLNTLLELGVRGADGRLVPLRELVRVQDSQVEQPIYHKDLLPVNFVVGDMAGKVDSPLYGLFSMRSSVLKLKSPAGGPVTDYFIHAPEDPYSGYSVKWDGEWQITYETFRDMGAAYGVGLILIYLLVVAQFGSYLMPLIIMAPIPLTIIGVMPGHALLGAQYTATSMIGMIALAGIIVRNSILLVDFIRLQVNQGIPFKEAIERSAAARSQPILLTGLAAMLGALFILDDPIFNGLAISLIFGVGVSTVLTLVVIPTLYYVVYRRTYETSQSLKENNP
jgi:multidrug efflux pump subunit AcrB